MVFDIKINYIIKSKKQIMIIRTGLTLMHKDVQTSVILDYEYGMITCP